MEQVNAPEGRWAISLCKCTEGMIHFTYGNATLHIAADDVGALSTALDRMARALAEADENEKKERSFH